MHAVHRHLFILALCTALCLTVGLRAEAGYRIGVLAKRGERKAIEQWGSTADYLHSRLSESFTVIPLKFTDIEAAVTSGNMDFLLANSAFFAEMQKKHNIRAVTTLINSRKGHALDKFGGVILVRKDSPIRTVGDIRGRRFMCVKYSSFGGAHMAWRLLLENGIDPKTDCAAFLEGDTHDNVVMAVKNNLVDAGTVRSDTLERMADEGKINMADFRIVNRIDDGFPFVHSTQLYPEWPLAACPKTDPATADRVAKALLATPSNDRSLKAAKIVGWNPPADYRPVAECLKAIKFGVFAD
jgi:two-component system sensor histidine kinase TtrS